MTTIFIPIINSDELYDPVHLIDVYVRKYGIQPLYDLVDDMIKLVNDAPKVVKYTGGLCHQIYANLRDKGLGITDSHSFSSLVMIMGSDWKHHSGNPHYPIALPESVNPNRLNPSELFFLATDQLGLDDVIDKESELKVHRDYYWTGEYGKRRIQFTEYCAKRLNTYLDDYVASHPTDQPDK